MAPTQSEAPDLAHVLRLRNRLGRHRWPRDLKRQNQICLPSAHLPRKRQTKAVQRCWTLTANDFNFWLSAQIAAAAERRRGQREREEADRRDCSAHSREEVSPPLQGSEPPAKHARTSTRAKAKPKHSPPSPSTAFPSTAIRSTAQRSEAQHSDSKHSTARKRMQGKVMADQAQRGPGG